MTELENKGGFTLPGEAGYEKLTLELAKKWGADVIRDSDGTELSPEITEAGYGIYSTICIIRGHNPWAMENLDKLQQTFLVTEPKTAVEHCLELELLKEFFQEQFKINDSAEALGYWQVYDRTTDKEVNKENWSYDKKKGIVRIENCVLWHKYTVSFLAYRIWEEISMYNHITNNWDKEHLIPIDPVYAETQVYLINWMKLYITFFLSFYILSNVRKALFYRLYGHFYFLFTFAYRGISSYVFPLKRGKFRGKYFYAIRRFISVLALSIEECAYQSIVILILE